MKLKYLPPQIRDNPLHYLRCRSVSKGDSSLPIYYNLIGCFLEDNDFEIQIGFSSFVVLHHPQLVQWGIFYPKQLLERNDVKGIGTISHLLSLRELEIGAGKDLSDYLITHPTSVREERQEHLAIMGIDYASSTPFREYFDKSLEFALKKGYLPEDVLKQKLRLA